MYIAVPSPERPRMSPHDGAIVELFDGAWHADPLTPEIIGQGAFLVFEDFQLAANSLGLKRGNASHAFTSLYDGLLRQAEDEVGRYGMGSPYYPYCNWGSSLNPRRRSELLLGTWESVELFTGSMERFTPTMRRVIQQVLKGTVE